MQTMSLSQWMDKAGAAFLHTIMIAALPTAAVAILVQSF